MALLWVRMIKRQRITAQETSAMEGDVLDVLQTLCARLDIPRPLWLKKHERDFLAFGHTAFTQEHFMEPISFDRLEIEWIDPDKPPANRRDPRNEA